MNALETWQLKGMSKTQLTWVHIIDFNFSLEKVAIENDFLWRKF